VLLYFIYWRDGSVEDRGAEGTTLKFVKHLSVII
jgi:hypothetical protein